MTLVSTQDTIRWLQSSHSWEDDHQMGLMLSGAACVTSLTDIPHTHTVKYLPNCFMTNNYHLESVFWNESSSKNFDFGGVLGASIQLQLLFQYICRNRRNWPNVKSSTVMLLSDFVARTVQPYAVYTDQNTANLCDWGGITFSSSVTVILKGTETESECRIKRHVRVKWNEWETQRGEGEIRQRARGEINWKSRE